MDALRSTATTVLRDLLSAQPDSPAKVTCAWQVAAGPAMGRASTVTRSADGVVRVVARTESWRREIARSRPILLERLRQLLGPDGVRTLVVATDDRDTARRRRPSQ